MAEKPQQNKTVFQKLNNLLTPDGVKPNIEPRNKYTMGNDVLLKTTNKAEYEKEALQAKQGKYLSNMWGKVEDNLFQQSIQYEMSRLSAYADYENMEFYPELAATLDILMEESTTVNDKGRVLNIYSDSPRIKGVLEDLFFNRLDIHTVLPMWVRNTCKYGDNFVYLNTSDKYGITGAKQMPNFEMERREGGVYDTISAKLNNMGNDSKDRSKEGKEERVRFFWRGRDLEFESWQIAHFRLLGDDRRLPYGTSVLEKSRRIWKQLLLSEDAMLVYRVTRAPERRVYKIYVGNIDDEDVQPYVNEIANRFKRANVIDPQTGQVDLRYNQLANDQDFFIPVRDENAPNPIDTLPGASNLDQIADIEYLQRKLFTALRVPKSFLGFDDPQGDGKNLALMDVRFARTVNRIQQSILQELNKIAIIHLVLLGFEDDLNSFTITMNNPSTQAEMLRIEHLQAKFAAMQAAVVDAGNGFGIMSMTRAKRDILGWSDSEIKQDLLEQRMEKAAAAELENTASVIKNTGFFDKVDKLYGDIKAAREGGQSGDEGNDAGGPAGGGGGFGGGGLGGNDIDFGDEEDTGAEDMGGDTGDNLDGVDAGAEDMGAEDAGAEDANIDVAAEGLAKTLKIGQRILAEQKLVVTNKLTKRKERFREIHMNRLMNNLTGDDKLANEINESRVSLTDKGMRINQSVDDMLKDINDRIESIDNTD